MSSLEDCNSALEIVSEFMTNDTLDNYRIDIGGLIEAGVVSDDPKDPEAYKVELVFEQQGDTPNPRSYPILIEHLTREGLSHVSLELTYVD